MGISVFWDNSNIWLVGRGVCSQREPGDELAFRIHFAHLLDFVINKRQLDYSFVCGSVPPSSDPLWRRFENLGIVVDRQERGQGTGGEVAVDEMIQLSMANRVLDVTPPETLVLLTGDGSGYTDGKGFITALERAHKHGWNVEVVSWDAGCNRYLQHFVAKNGTYRSLEPVYDKVTFINNKRWAQPVL
jgi:NYN domain-containing protein